MPLDVCNNSKVIRQVYMMCNSIIPTNYNVLNPVYIIHTRYILLYHLAVHWFGAGLGNRIPHSKGWVCISISLKI